MNKNLTALIIKIDETILLLKRGLIIMTDKEREDLIDFQNSLKVLRDDTFLSWSTFSAREAALIVKFLSK